MNIEPIKSRLVFNFAGFEQSHPEKLVGRLLYCAKKASQLWGFSFQNNEPDHHEDSFCSRYDTRCQGDGWSVSTRIVQFGFGDIVREYENQLYPFGFLKNLTKFIVILCNGTAYRYFKSSKLYAAFILFPIILMLVFATLSHFVTVFFMDFFLIKTGFSPASIIVSLVLFFLLCKWPGTQLHLLLTVSHWGFAQDIAHRSNFQIEERYQQFAKIINDEISRKHYDEIIIAGHSFGSTWASVALGMALDANPMLLKERKTIFIRLGSVLLNTALMKRAEFIRSRIAQLASVKEIFWHELQSKDDVISFYKADLFKLLNIAYPVGGFKISRVNFKQSMSLNRYRKMKRSFYDTHRQYGLYQDRRSHTDFMLNIFGPVSGHDLANNPGIVNNLDRLRPFRLDMAGQRLTT